VTMAGGARRPRAAARSPDTRLPMLPVPSPDVIHRALPEGGILFHCADEVYFGLNPVGVRVWALLPPAHETLDGLCGALAAEYPDAPPEAIRADVAELLDALAAHGLVRAPGAAAAADAA
jgi:hypothetical protein